jgi:hypothetical protein
VCASLLAAGCREPGEREAAELARLRQDATAGIEAVEAFCTARDSAIAHVEQDVPGAPLILEEVLRAPVVLDDYCEEFRFHEHDEPADSAGHTDRPATVHDSAAAGPAAPSGS